MLAELLPPLVLVLFWAAVFGPELLGGPIAYGRDTTVFYYPLTEWAAEQLRAGRLPAWTPYIFGGYPVLADGEIGLLSPVHVGFLLGLPTPLAYAWSRAAHVLIAALGVYALARALGANGLGACIGGLAFAYGSFVVGHLQHDNIVRSTAWIPWLLLAAERALRTRGVARTAWVAAGAVALALAALGVHVQPVLLGLIALAAYVVVGPFGGAVDGRPPVADGLAAHGASGAAPSAAARLGGVVRNLRTRGLDATLGPWIKDRFVVGCGIVVLGLGLAGAQLLPLYDLGQRSLRPSLVTYAYATSYAVSPPQILTLVFPAMFNFDHERHWTLWSPHETTLHVGVVPLVLALVALACVRGRAVAFFGVLAFVSLLLAFGDYLPVKPYGLVWQLPGFNVLRAPARFALLLQLSLALLAALGLTWLARRAGAGRASRVLPAFLAGLMLLPAGLALAFGGLRWWLQHDPSTATTLLHALVQTSRENWQLGGWHVYYGLLDFTRPGNWRTLLGLALLAGAPLVARAWLARPRLAGAWGAALLAATCLELWVFTTYFYPRAHPDQLRPSIAAATFLAARPEPTRAFVEPTLNQPLGANMLTRLGVATVNGYSSLEPPRFTDYWWSLVAQDNFLLDLFAVEYVVAARQAPGARVFEGTTFHPADRLLSGTAGNPSGEEVFRVPPTTVDRLIVVGAVEGLGDAPAGTPVAEVTLYGRDGAALAVPLRAGIELAEHLAPEPGYPMAGYAGPRVVWAGPLFTPTGNGPPVRLYGAAVPLDAPFEAVGMSARALATTGRVHLHGIGLRPPDGAVHAVRPADRAKYRRLLESQSWELLENTAAWPRVSAVGGAIPGEPGLFVADQLHRRPWDPRRSAIVDGLGPADARDPVGDGPPGRVALVSYEPSRVVVRADMDAPGYVVLADRYDEGWRAFVDDRQERVMRANGIARAVLVPAGSHVVTFVYDSFAFTVGLVVSALAAAALAALLLAALLGPLVRPRRAPAG